MDRTHADLSVGTCGPTAGDGKLGTLRPSTAVSALAALFVLVLAYPDPAFARPRARSSSTRAGRPHQPPTRAGEPLPELLARTFRTYGGLDAILAVEGVRLHGTITDETTAPESQPRVERVLQPPDRYRSAVSLAGVERETLVLDGKRAFRDGAEVTGLARADQIRLEAARVFLPAALARGRDALVDRGEQRRGADRVRLVELAIHKQASLTAEIDPSSGRIVRAVTRVAGRQSAVSYRSFRPVEGVLFPFAEDLESKDGKRTQTVLLDDIDLVTASSITIRQP